MLTKQCSKCKQNKPIEQFGEYKKNKDGLRGWCKSCTHEYNVVYHQENREHTNEQNRKWIREHKEQWDKTHQKWLKDNEEHVSDYFKKFHIEHKKQRNEKSNNHYKNNPERYKKNVSKYRNTPEGRQVKKQSDAKRKPRCIPSYRREMVCCTHTIDIT